MQRCVMLSVMVVLAMSVGALADECFNTSGTVTVNAQMIRKAGATLGWTVGKTASVTAAGVAGGKKQIYPQDEVEVCLRVDNGVLQIRAQSKASDAGKAEWHKLPAKRIKVSESKEPGQEI